MRDVALGELTRQVLRPFDARRTDQNRLTRLVALGDVVDDGGELRLFRLVNQIALILADHRLVGRDREHAELVDLVELRGLGLRGTRHARELVVQTEVVLERDRGECLVLRLDLDALFGLDRLVQTLVEATAVEHATGELVDDEHLTVADDVVLVAVEEFLDLDRVVQIADQRRVGGLVEVVDAELILDEFDARLVHADRLLLDVDLVVDVTLEQRRDTRELGVPLARSLGGTRDDQRCPRLIDQDRVDLVDDGEVVATLHEILECMRHVVAQVVEAELVVGAVGDVGGVGDLALLGSHPGQDHRGLET